MSTTTEAPAVPRRKRRGTENVRDMVLSLLACLVVIVPIWLLGSPTPDNEAAIRPVDPSADVAAFRTAAPGVPAPSAVPEGWTATSSTLDGESLRIGYVTPGEGYAEYMARAGEPGTFVDDQTGQGTQGSALTVDGRRFTVWSAGGGDHTSLVLQGAGGTVVLGGLRETADDELLTTLAGTLR